MAQIEARRDMQQREPLFVHERRGRGAAQSDVQERRVDPRAIAAHQVAKGIHGLPMHRTEEFVPAMLINAKRLEAILGIHMVPSTSLLGGGQPGPDRLERRALP